MAITTLGRRRYVSSDVSLHLRSCPRLIEWVGQKGRTERYRDKDDVSSPAKAGEKEATVRAWTDPLETRSLARRSVQNGSACGLSDCS